MHLEITLKLLLEGAVMKRHSTTSAVNTRRFSRGGPGTSRVHESVRLEPDPPRPRPEAAELVLTSVDPWNHRLVLTGELTHRSAHALEVEIERLCEEGVTDITLDLRDLTSIDPVGVAVIAFRCGLCEKRGYGFRLIRGPQVVQVAFERAGLLEMLPFKEADEAVAGPAALGHRPLDAIER
jgi:anti-anti-sigma factor